MISLAEIASVIFDITHPDRLNSPGVVYQDLCINIISVHTEQSYYQDKSGKYCDAYRIVADSDFCGEKETPRNFKLMRIKREILEQKEKSSHLSKEELLKMMLGD